MSTEATTTEALIESGPVLLDLDGGVARLRLNRPDASNAMDVPFLKALFEAVMRCHSDGRVRAVLISGEGQNFCTGGDVHDFASKGEALPEYLREATTWLGATAAALTRLDAPVITIVHGFAAGGGGFGLVCASDIVIAAQSSRFLPGATRVGMAPDAGTTVTLTRLVGLRRAMEIALTNPIMSAAEALEFGIVTRVVGDDELLAAGLELARELAAGATLALGATKRLLWDGLGATMEARLSEESRIVSQLSGTADAREGLAAVIERRAPEFKGR